MSIPLLSALTLNYRNALAVVKCVGNFLSQTIADRMEVIVVDNHSQDDSIGILRNQLPDLPNVRIVETENNRGFGRGYNFGARFARGEYLLINNPDKLLELSALERMVQKMESDPAIGILAPKIIYSDGTLRPSIRAYPRPLDLLIKRTFLRTLFPRRVAHYLQLDRDPDRESDVDWVVGGCFLIRRNLFEELHGFDDRFFLFFEDTDLCRRAWERGKCVVYFPSVSATDRRRRLSGETLWDVLFTNVGRIHLQSAVRYFRKWGTA